MSSAGRVLPLQGETLGRASEVGPVPRVLTPAEETIKEIMADKGTVSASPARRRSDASDDERCVRYSRYAGRPHGDRGGDPGPIRRP